MTKIPDPLTQDGTVRSDGIPRPLPDPIMISKGWGEGRLMPTGHLTPTRVRGFCMAFSQVLEFDQ